MPACHNILHCHPEQLFPFLAQSGLSSYYTGRKKREQGEIAAAAAAEREMQKSNYSAVKGHKHTKYTMPEREKGRGGTEARAKITIV